VGAGCVRTEIIGRLPTERLHRARQPDVDVEGALLWIVSTGFHGADLPRGLGWTTRVPELQSMEHKGVSGGAFRGRCPMIRTSEYLIVRATIVRRASARAPGVRKQKKQGALGRSGDRQPREGD